MQTPRNEVELNAGRCNVVWESLEKLHHSYIFHTASVAKVPLLCQCRLAVDRGGRRSDQRARAFYREEHSRLRTGSGCFCT